jgi:hypothetical protein
MPTVVALAGRRIDAPRAEAPRFPLANVPLVTERVRETFTQLAARTLVCSAACGGDLIALDVAAERGLDAYIVLPFDPDRFRTTSVDDRPGDWGPRYDRAIAQAQAARRLEVIVADHDSSDAEAYAAVNDRILKRALELAGNPADVVAVAVWEGRPRGEGDLTWWLLCGAERAGVAIESVLTLPDAETG